MFCISSWVLVFSIGKVMFLLRVVMLVLIGRVSVRLCVFVSVVLLLVCMCRLLFW